MFDLFKRKPPPEPILRLLVDGTEACRFGPGDIPAEKTPSVRVDKGSTVEFVDAAGAVHRHALGDTEGYAHFSVRTNPNLAILGDCVVTGAPEYDPAALRQPGVYGIRFQPFFLTGATVDLAQFIGQGLFVRGLHFSGHVTPGNVRLSCVCDACGQSFLLQSFHCGFGNCCYFYSASGRYTLIVGDQVEGCPAALSAPDPAALAALEQRFPDAPDGTTFRYDHPLRCPHCGAAYIDFAAHPGLRQNEYYGNHFVGLAPLGFDPASSAAAASR